MTNFVYFCDELADITFREALTLLLSLLHQFLEDNFDISESWLEKNDFTDFLILRDGNEEHPDICGATAEIHIFRVS